MPNIKLLFSMDNSEYNRNGDFAPSRWESQHDAATNICDVKLNQNPENTLGIMAIAGNRYCNQENLSKVNALSF